MASAATSGYSTKFQTNATGSMVTIAEVVNITGPGKQVKTIDVSNMDSPGAVEEFVMGMINNGQVGLEINFLPNNTTQTQIQTDMDARTKRGFQIIWANGSVWTFSGYYIKFEPSAPHDGAMRAKCDIQITGVFTYPS